MNFFVNRFFLQRQESPARQIGSFPKSDTDVAGNPAEEGGL